MFIASAPVLNPFPSTNLRFTQFKIELKFVLENDEYFSAESKIDLLWVFISIYKVCHEFRLTKLLTAFKAIVFFRPNHHNQIQGPIQ